MIEPDKILKIFEKAGLDVDALGQKSEWKPGQSAKLIDMFPDLSKAIKNAGDEWVKQRRSLPPVEQDIENLSQEIVTLIKAYRRAEDEHQDGKDSHILFEMLSEKADTLSFILRRLGDIL